MTPSFTDDIVLVTGGSGDLGGEIVRSFLAGGARVASCDLVATSAPDSDTFVSSVVDVSDPRAVEAWVTSVVNRWGTPTVAVLAAGTVTAGRLIDLTIDQWRATLDSCLTGAFVPAAATIRAMLAGSRGGRIVAIGSWAATSPHPHIGAYTAAKAGLRGLVRTLALDHAQDGILINEVAPGVISAGLSGRLLAEDDALRDRTLGSIPLGRVSTPADVARDVLFLASSENRTTTGTVLVTDGGLSLASTMNPGRS